MSTLEEALAAKEKFKEQFWKNSSDKINLIALADHDVYDEISGDVIDTFFSVKVFFFNMEDAAGLPNNIDGVQFHYLPVMEPETPDI